MIQEIASPAPAASTGAVPRIWVFIESLDGEPQPVSWELLGAAAELALELPGSAVEAVAVGHRLERARELAHSYGASRLYLADDPTFECYRTRPYSAVVGELVKEWSPEIFLVGATSLGRDLAPAVATLVGTGLTADCTELRIDPDTHLLEATRPTFGGNLMATILCRTRRPQMATVRPRVLPLPLPAPSATAAAEATVAVRARFAEPDLAVRRLRVIKTESEAHIEQARTIVAGGIGMGGPDGFALLEELADVLGGEVGASRRAVDAGWISYDHQVGQTGKTVRPQLYIAAGISGAVQHRIGMANSDYVLAINQDRGAPIFQFADLGIVGDAREVVPELTRQMQAGSRAHGTQERVNAV